MVRLTSKLCISSPDCKIDFGERTKRTFMQSVGFDSQQTLSNQLPDWSVIERILGRTLLTRDYFQAHQKSTDCTLTGGRREKVHLQRELDRNLLPLVSLAGPLTSLP